MANKSGALTDTSVSYIASGAMAFLILLLAAKAAWSLWVIVPLGVLAWFYLVHSPRRQRRLTGTPPSKVVIKPARAGSLPSRDARRVGWNALGSLNVRDDDPYVVIKGESPPDGVAVAVPTGRWQVHVRSEMIAKPLHMRDAELRIVQDPRWVSESWEWTANWEPLLGANLATTAQSGRIAVDAGLLRVHSGRKVRASRGITLLPGFADGAFGVNVVRDLAGHVVAIVSRFG